MKKTYIYPTIDIHEMGTKNILMSSLIEKGMGDEVDIVITDDPIIEDADEAVSREDDFDWSTLIMIFVFTLFRLNVSAQNAEPAPPIDGK